MLVDRFSDSDMERTCREYNVRDLGGDTEDDSHVISGLHSSPVDTRRPLCWCVHLVADAILKYCRRTM